MSYLPLRFYLLLKSRQCFMPFIFICKHFNTFLIFNLCISQKVKGGNMENLKTNISTYFYICTSLTFKIIINQGIFLSKRVCRQPPVCAWNVFTLLKGFWDTWNKGFHGQNFLPTRLLKVPFSLKYFNAHQQARSILFFFYC